MVHIRDIAYIPPTDILIKCRPVDKGICHICDRGNIPVADVTVGGIGFRLVIKPEVDGTLEVGVGKRYDLREMNGQSDGRTQAGYDIGTAGAIEVAPFNLSGVFIGPVNMVVWHIECKVEGTAKAGEKGNFVGTVEVGAVNLLAVKF